MKLELFFDPTCPFCYRGWNDLKSVLSGYSGVEIDWQPCEAHPIETERTELRKWWSDRADSVSVERGGQHCDLAIQGMLYVIDRGADVVAFIERFYQGVFEEGKKQESVNFLISCAEAAGVNAEAFGEAIISGAYLKRQQAVNSYAYDKCGVWAVPTLRVGDRQLDSVEGVGLTKVQMAEFIAETMSHTKG